MGQGAPHPPLRPRFPEARLGPEAWVPLWDLGADWSLGVTSLTRPRLPSEGQKSSPLLRFWEQL